MFLAAKVHVLGSEISQIALSPEREKCGNSSGVQGAEPFKRPDHTPKRPIKKWTFSVESQDFKVYSNISRVSFGAITGQFCAL